MSHVFRLSDEQYAKLAAYAARQKQTPETLFEKWVNEVTHYTETSSDRIKQEGPKGRERCEEEPLTHPLLKVAGMFAIGEPGWADKHDEYLAEAYVEDHANN
jgi:hypothetical protein